MPRDDIPIIQPYNPLDKLNLGRNVAAAMLSTPMQKLPPEPFIGAGCYAIYYRGDFEPYRRLALANADEWRIPIYVGKAVPAGARKGGFDANVDHGTALFKRLSEHFASVSAATNLNPDDFMCRFLVVDDIWIPLTESLLIERFKPLWNRCMDGFGNHDPGAGRYAQQKSPWDCIHPGREWAERLRPNASTNEQILAKVRNYLEANIPQY